MRAPMPDHHPLHRPAATRARLSCPAENMQVAPVRPMASVGTPEIRPAIPQGRSPIAYSLPQDRTDGIVQGMHLNGG